MIALLQEATRLVDGAQYKARKIARAQHSEPWFRFALLLAELHARLVDVVARAGGVPPLAEPDVDSVVLGADLARAAALMQEANVPAEISPARAWSQTCMQVQMAARDVDAGRFQDDELRERSA